ncbi:MAG: hypothetical protein ACE5EQ_05175 [Phycisphaerae bacterium]
MGKKQWVWAGIMCFGLVAVACNGNFLGGIFGGDETVASFLPDDISLDISELPDSDTATGKASNSDLAITGVSAYDKTLRATGAIMHAFHRMANKAFALGAAVKLDIDDANANQIADTITVNGVEVAYRADFSAFDIDGDGTADGSGKINQEPVALRMWVDRGNGFERFLCALVSTRPTTANIGAGQVFVKPNAANGNLFADLMIFTKWDRTDTAHKWNEAFVSGQVRPNYVMSASHQRVDIRTQTDGTVEKTVRSTSKFTSSPFGFDTYSFSSHWKKGSGAVLISGLSTGGIAQVDFTDVCVSLTDRTLATTGACDGFDTQDNAFLSAPVGTENDFPADFPAQPTFTPPTDVSDNTNTNSSTNTNSNSQSQTVG